jgi:hypothetical protein
LEARDDLAIDALSGGSPKREIVDLDLSLLSGSVRAKRHGEAIAGVGAIILSSVISAEAQLPAPVLINHLDRPSIGTAQYPGHSSRFLSLFS